MSKKPGTEVELSPMVTKYWKEKGYCVHGEVAIFGRSTFVDHVAHTGPCHDPDYIVGIEMKRGGGKALRKQMFKLDVKHVADELWGVVISNPREATLEKWKENGRWNMPGLMVWTEEGLETLVEPKENREYKRAMKRDKLLLIKENKDIIAGYPSGHEDNDYLTHFSYTKDEILKQIEKGGLVSCEDLYDNLPYSAEPYKRKKSAMNRMLTALEEKEGKIILSKREGRTRFYKIDESDSLRWDIDTRFEDLFENDED